MGGGASANKQQSSPAPRVVTARACRRGASALPPWRRRRLPRPRKSRGRGRPAPPRPSTGGRRAAEGGPRRGHSGRRRRRTAAASKSYPRHAPVQNWVFLWILRRRTMCGRVLTLASEGSAGVEFWQHAAPEVR
ncbi:unnamed protein product [Prorocentrum cordatum]|uniref:Uncharacterized protein n=1 Tax=Prorocentrum cordatum TaxID=2364126 RepID=A0ABN9SP49_9DINO|nr:unnamed protein product [Polarella glacialis]